MTTVLTIDDSVTIRRSVAIALRKVHFTVIEAEDGPLGLEQAASAKPDLILLDINLTIEMNGFEVLKRLKNDAKTKDIPVVMLTSVGESPEVVMATRLGAVDFIVKPFQPDQLAQKIFRQLESRRPAATAPAVSPPGAKPQPSGQSFSLDSLEAQAGGAFKALLIMCPTELRSELTTVLNESCGVTEYSEVTSCRVEDNLAGLDASLARPETDSLLVAPIAEAQCQELCDRIRAWKKASAVRRHLHVLVMPVEERV